jgi:uroporphyrinogen decarboxylase
VRDEAAVARLAVPDMDKLRYVFDAVTSIRKALNGRVPLIGFPAAPGRWPATWSKAPAPTTTAWSRPCCTPPDLMHRILGGQCRRRGAT